jgi:hypothetical protein
MQCSGLCIFVCVACFTAGRLVVDLTIPDSYSWDGCMEGWTETLLELFLTEEKQCFKFICFH